MQTPLEQFVATVQCASFERRHLELEQVPSLHWAVLLQVFSSAYFAEHFFSLRLQKPLVQLASCVAISAGLLVDVNPFGLHAPPFGIPAFKLAMLTHNANAIKIFLNII